MPRMVSWLLNMTIQIRNKITVNIYERIYGSNFSDEYISSGGNIYFLE